MNREISCVCDMKIHEREKRRWNMSMNPRTPWKGTMTQRERFNALMHYKTFDRTVNMEFGYWKENYEQWDIFTENNIKNEKQANDFFAFEPPVCVSGSIEMDPPFEPKIIEDRGRTVVRVSRDGLWEEVPKEGSSIPKYLRSSIETPEDWEELKKRSFDRFSESRKPNFEVLDDVCREDRDYPVGVNCGSMIGRIRDILTVEGLSYAVMDYPEMVEDMVETHCDLVCDYLDAVLPHYHFDFAYGWEDICCKNGPLVNMDFFRSVIYPCYKRIGNKLHKYGVDIWYTDCDGDVRPLLPYFLDAGINCLFPYEVNGCSHPSELLEQYGKDLRIMGGFNKMAMIEGKDAIKAYMKSLEPLVARGGYIPFCDHRCPPDVTPENYLYYLDLKEKTFGIS